MSEKKHDVIADCSLDELRTRAAKLGVSDVLEMDRSALIAALGGDLPGEASSSHVRPAKPAVAEVAMEAEPGEPTDIYIDRGLPLPESYAGTRLRVLIRDPGTLYVYWDVDDTQQREGWEVVALDSAGKAIASFRSPSAGAGQGYFNIPVARVARVALHPLDGGVSVKTAILGVAVVPDVQPEVVGEQWVNVHTDEIAVAPSAGQAPAAQVPESPYTLP